MDEKKTADMSREELIAELNRLHDENQRLREQLHALNTETLPRNLLELVG